MAVRAGDDPAAAHEAYADVVWRHYRNGAHETLSVSRKLHLLPNRRAHAKSDEPGAMRALHHAFEPYEQTIARIEALEAIGHPTEKIELLILGATWSAYPFDYQKWFIQRCLDAMNGFDSPDLHEAQQANEEQSIRMSDW